MNGYAVPSKEPHHGSYTDEDRSKPSLSILAVNGATVKEDLPVSFGRNELWIITVAPDISPPSRAFRQGKKRGS